MDAQHDFAGSCDAPSCSVPNPFLGAPSSHSRCPLQQCGQLPPRIFSTSTGAMPSAAPLDTDTFDEGAYDIHAEWDHAALRMIPSDARGPLPRPARRPSNETVRRSSSGAASAELGVLRQHHWPQHQPAHTHAHSAMHAHAHGLPPVPSAGGYTGTTAREHAAPHVPAARPVTRRSARAAPAAAAAAAAVAPQPPPPAPHPSTHRRRTSATNRATAPAGVAAAAAQAAAPAPPPQRKASAAERATLFSQLTPADMPRLRRKGAIPLKDGMRHSAPPEAATAAAVAPQHCGGASREATPPVDTNSDGARCGMTTRHIASRASAPPNFAAAPAAKRRCTAAAEQPVVPQRRARTRSGSCEVGLQVRACGVPVETRSC